MPDPSVPGANRWYAAGLVLVTVGILYGSLYPFELGQSHHTGSAIGHLIGTWHNWDRRGDLIANILLYLPLGFFAGQAMPPRFSARLRLVIAMAMGAGLAACVEFLQFYDPSRVSTLGDVYADAIGAALGAVGAAAVGASMRWPLLVEGAAHPGATLVLVLFLAHRLYPYVPTIDMHKYWHAVRDMLLAPRLPPGALVHDAIVWLLVASVIYALYGYRRWLWLFMLFVAVEFLGRILIVSTNLDWPDVIGAGLALVLWAWLSRLNRGRFTLIAILFLLLLLARRLDPFTFSPTPLRSFGWVPFRSFFSATTHTRVPVVWEKWFLYAGTIWLLSWAGIALPVGTAITCTVLLTTSFAQIYLPGRSAEITDGVMALLLGLSIGGLRNLARRTGYRASPPSRAAEEQQRLVDSVMRQHGQRSD